MQAHGSSNRDSNGGSNASNGSPNESSNGSSNEYSNASPNGPADRPADSDVAGGIAVPRHQWPPAAESIYKALVEAVEFGGDVFGHEIRS